MITNGTTLKVTHLRENLLPILTLATAGGVGVSVGVIGLVLHLGMSMTWSSALLFRSINSATDPVSVLALFKTLRAPARLTAIVEAESLLNDGTAMVVFRIILGIVTGAVTVESTGGLILGSLREFGVVVIGGIAAGAIIGFVASTLTSHFDDHLLENHADHDRRVRLLPVGRRFAGVARDYGPHRWTGFG